MVDQSLARLWWSGKQKRRRAAIKALVSARLLIFCLPKLCRGMHCDRSALLEHSRHLQSGADLLCRLRTLVKHFVIGAAGSIWQLRVPCRASVVCCSVVEHTLVLELGLLEVPDMQ